MAAIVDEFIVVATPWARQYAQDWDSAVLATAGLVCLLLIAEYLNSPLLRLASKPLASLAFLAAALFAMDRQHHSGFGRFVVAGLALSWVGDVCLISASELLFKLGLGAFLCGHVMYSVAFVTRGVHVAACWYALLFAVPCFAAIGVWLVPRVPRDLLVPVCAYMAVIMMMTVLAAGTMGHSGAHEHLLGAVLFAVSDVFVARDKFVAAGVANRFVGLPLYYAAQLVLAHAITK